MAGQWNDKRPMAPHLQIWRWHPAMLSSILHRASAIICYVALLLVAIAILCVALSGELPLQNLIYSPLGAIGFFVFLFAFLFMTFAQLRHAVWAKGAMMNPELNNMLSYVMIVGSLILSALTTLALIGSM